MEDLISRQDAIDMFQNLAYDDWNQGVSTTWANAFAESADMIKDLPSAQPETANRIVGKSKDGMTLWYQCDMCNEHVDAQDNFCRGCGRRLTGWMI